MNLVKAYYLASTLSALCVTAQAAPTTPQARIGAAYSGTPIDVLTYHYDNLRTGWNQNETDLTPASVASKHFGLLATLTVDGLVTAEPLIVSNFVMPDGTTHNVVIVVTNNNSVYAYDDQTLALLWQVNLGPCQPGSDVPGANWNEFGIGSTPVIIRSASDAATIYLVNASEPTAGSFQHQLHALSLATGQDIQTPALITASTVLSKTKSVIFNPLAQYSRAGLAYARGTLYVGITSHGDVQRDSISGWLLGYNANLQQTALFNTSSALKGVRLGSIWMSGFAPAIDGNGNILFATGNGQVASGTDPGYALSAVSLSPDLKTVNTSFTQANWAAIDQNDGDLGSGGLMLLPAQPAGTPPLAVAMGKTRILYLLNETQLGGLQAGDAGTLQQITVPGVQGVWGGPAYYAGPAGSFVYYQVYGAPLTAYALTTGPTPSLAPVAAGATKAGYGGSLPVVSSNGAAPNTGVVWLIRRERPLQLEAYNATTLGKPIFTAAAGSWFNPTGVVNATVTPLVANGRVYAPASGTVSVFGLTP